MNLREKYLSVKSGVLGQVEVDQWGTVYIRALTLADLDKSRGVQDTDAVLATILLGVCDQDGNKVFTEGDREALLNSTPFNVLAQVAEAVGQFNGLTVDKVAEKKSS